jgi:hypothetical protein
LIESTEILSIVDLSQVVTSVGSSSVVIPVRASGSEGEGVGQGGGNALSLGVGIGVGSFALVGIAVVVVVFVKRRHKGKTTVGREVGYECEMDARQYQGDDLDSDDTQFAQKGVFGVDIWATGGNNLPGSFLDFNVEEARSL